MKKSVFIPFVVFLIIIGCKSQIVQPKHQSLRIEKTDIPIREYTIQAVLWQQQAAEYRALSYQAFNLAQMQLHTILDRKSDYKKPIAIVTDIDETVLDNSRYSGKQIEFDEAYSASRWIEWVKEKKANAIPGALDFFNYAKSKDVAVFYISNRSTNQKEETIENLQRIGFPFADPTHVLLKDSTSEKKPRRLLVQKEYEIVLLIGDNLSDFSAIFENRSTTERNRSVDSLKAFFGKKIHCIT